MTVLLRCSLPDLARPFVLLTGLFVVLLVTGCRAPQTQSSSERVDDVGRRITVVNEPRRVVTLAPSLTEMVIAAGGVDRLVAVSNADNLQETDSLLKLSALPVDFESVISVDPDLVLLLEGFNRIEDAERLASLGIPCFVISSRSINDVFEDIRSIGRLLGTGPAADSHASLLETALRSITELVPPESAKPRVLFLIGDDELYAFGRGSYMNDVIEKAGGLSITASIEQENAVLSEEYVITENPDVIVIANSGPYDAASLLAKHPTWAGLDAIRNGQVLSVEADAALRVGPRLVNTVTVLASKFHPEAFRNPTGGVLVIE